MRTKQTAIQIDLNDFLNNSTSFIKKSKKTPVLIYKKGKIEACLYPINKSSEEDLLLYLSKPFQTALKNSRKNTIPIEALIKKYEDK